MSEIRAFSKVYFDDPATGARLQARHPTLAAFPFEMVQVARETSEEIERLRHRLPDDIGQIVRERYLAHNAPVLAGTRIPTSAVWDFHRAGYSVEGIVAEYPTLRAEDVVAAISYEEQRRAS